MKSYELFSKNRKLCWRIRNFKGQLSSDPIPEEDGSFQKPFSWIAELISFKMSYISRKLVDQMKSNKLFPKSCQIFPYPVPETGGPFTKSIVNF
jgi:hypothetical protein